eukprot:TRINITY_DN51982_c0_g1_i1.p2 TRINITY_DN51982_c0_g1~~TRINITY_DN51982_c0_g1_i1.p2  ORF type:complete len:113 (+),score=20.42 TRINITY_DN51982_c0_g1_i1:196-534(+)
MEPSAPSLREPFIPEDEVRMQNRVIQQQDANISALSDAVNNIHQTAGAIHSEVTEQNALLDDLDDGVGNTQRNPVSYTHLRAHETSLHLVCRLLLEKKKTHHKYIVKATMSV